MGRHKAEGTDTDVHTSFAAHSPPAEANRLLDAIRVPLRDLRGDGHGAQRAQRQKGKLTASHRGELLIGVEDPAWPLFIEE